MALADYQGLQPHCRAVGFNTAWTGALGEIASERLHRCSHGDLPRWREALKSLPSSEPLADLGRAAPRFGAKVSDKAALREALMALHPWRKGPLEIGGIKIHTEWRSDWKWSRLEDRVQFRGRRILDVGCGNGYFGWRMLAGGADLVIGIDPTWVFVMQWLACRHFSGDLPNFVLPLGIEHLPAGPAAFDSVFSMGVLYHRRDPMEHLGRLFSLLRPGGELVLETLVLPDEESDEALSPTGRYARMRNVWAIPGCGRLTDWVAEAGFADGEIVDVTTTSVGEQRSTEWMTFESLDRALDPHDPGRTVEGHPAPRRAVLVATRPR